MQGVQASESIDAKGVPFLFATGALSWFPKDPYQNKRSAPHARKNPCLQGVPCRLNAAEMLVDVEKTKEGTDTQWLAESGVVDLFILLGPSPKDVCPPSPPHPHAPHPPPPHPTLRTTMQFLQSISGTKAQNAAKRNLSSL